MGKNEIKLRRQMLDPGDIGHYRDYPALVKQHERKQRHRRYMKIFTYSMLVTLIVMLLLIIISYMMIRWEKKRESDRKNQITTSVQSLFTYKFRKTASGCDFLVLRPLWG